MQHTVCQRTVAAIAREEEGLVGDTILRAVQPYLEGDGLVGVFRRIAQHGQEVVAVYPLDGTTALTFDEGTHFRILFFYAIGRPQRGQDGHIVRIVVDVLHLPVHIFITSSSAGRCAGHIGIQLRIVERLCCCSLRVVQVTFSRLDFLQLSLPGLSVIFGKGGAALDLVTLFRTQVGEGHVGRHHIAGQRTNPVPFRLNGLRCCLHIYQLTDKAQLGRFVHTNLIHLTGYDAAQRTDDCRMVFVRIGHIVVVFHFFQRWQYRLEDVVYRHLRSLFGLQVERHPVPALVQLTFLVHVVVGLEYHGCVVAAIGSIFRELHDAACRTVGQAVVYPWIDNTCRAVVELEDDLLFVLVGSAWVWLLDRITVDDHVHIVGITCLDELWMSHADAIAPYVKGANLCVFIFQNLVAYIDLSCYRHVAGILVLISVRWAR